MEWLKILWIVIVFAFMITAIFMGIIYWVYKRNQK